MSETVRLPEQVQPPYRVTTRDSDRFNRYRFTLFRNNDKVGRGTHFLGGNHIKPWIELQPDTIFSPEQAEHRQLFAALTDILEPGSHIMVHYLQDTDTAEALTADVPPPATPLGFLLWQAGVRWFKDWYFTEGWMEGDQKLQGNLPLDTKTRQEREAEWRDVLHQFVSEPDTVYTDCQKRVEQILAAIKENR